MYKRNQTRQIDVKGVKIGGQDKVVIQSMTNTKTKRCRIYSKANI